jgi:hypothetical protein
VVSAAGMCIHTTSLFTVRATCPILQVMLATGAPLHHQLPCAMLATTKHSSSACLTYLCGPPLRHLNTMSSTVLHTTSDTWPVPTYLQFSEVVLGICQQVVAHKH